MTDHDRIVRLEAIVWELIEKLTNRALEEHEAHALLEKTYVRALIRESKAEQRVAALAEHLAEVSDPPV